MLLAKCEQQWVRASQRLDKTKQYYCPDCQQPVYMKYGQHKQAHFCHYRQCTQMGFSEGETVEHLAGKQLLYEWLSQQGHKVVLEAYLPKLHQRPDVLYWNKYGQPIVIEFQCSHIEATQLLARTQGYWRHGYQVHWVLGQHLFHKQGLSFCIQANPLSCYHLDVNAKRLVVKTQAHVQRATYVSYQLQQVDDSILMQQQKRSDIMANQQCLSIYQAYKRLSKACRLYLYQRRYSLERIPMMLCAQPLYYAGLKTRFVDYLVYLYCSQCLNEQAIYLKTQQLLATKTITLVTLPLIDKTHYLKQLAQDVASLFQQCQLFEV